MAEEVQRRRARVLMLEDSPLDAELAIERLRRADLQLEITLSVDRRSFEEALQAREYDLILADYALPDFDGMAALTLSRQLLPSVPFIFISGRVGEEVAIDTLQRGATDYVLKHRLERLVPAVLRALRESEEHATRVRAEALFRQSELRFRYVIDAVPQMIWIAAPSGRLSYANKLWNDYTASAAAWCEPELIHPDDYPSVEDAWHRALDHTRPFHIEARFLRQEDRSYRWHLLRMLPMELDPELPLEQEVFWLGAAADVQDQKRNEEALRTADKLAVTGRMAATIAHEINNPLESLTNLIFLVRLESEGNERALSYLDMTENELARISAITKQTLQFYRDPLMPVPVDAGEILDEVLRLFSTRFTAKGVVTSVSIEPGIVFEAIKGEVRQVLINLINNAIDAVPSGGRMEVSVARTALHDRPALEVLVRDSGPGITAAQEERLFEPFFSTKGAHGTGLGLWVSKGIVEKHRGTLRLSSEMTSDGSRTTARVLLPIEAAPELHQIENQKI